MRILLFSRLPHSKPLAQNRQSGFTLIELLLIVVLLGVVSIAAINAFDGNEEQARLNITRLEMAELQKALLQFRRDNRELPCMVYKQGDYSPNTVNTSYGTANYLSFMSGFDLSTVPSNASEWREWCESDYRNINGKVIASNALVMANLFPYDIADFDFLTWNASTQLGWNGAYLNLEGLTDGWGNAYLLLDPELSFSTLHRCLVNAGGDNYDTTGDLYGCLTPNQTGFVAADHIMPADIARLISKGPNGLLDTSYDPNPAIGQDPCIAEGDDLVLCLFR
jgi:type II secretory pathway pseudopilin PulG